jgi:hypothetical protein
MRWSGILTDGVNGTVSSRRVVTLLAFALCAVAFIANLFFGMKIDQFIFDSMSYIAMAGLGATVAEKFSTSASISTKEKYYQEEQREYYKDYCRNNNPRSRRTPIPKQHDPLI